MEVFKLQDKKTFSERLVKNELIILRNKIAAHPSNYKDIKQNSEHKFDVNEICRPDLEIGQIKLLRNQNNFEKYDLNNSIKDFDELIEEILSQIIGKIIKKLFKN